MLFRVSHNCIHRLFSEIIISPNYSFHIRFHLHGHYDNLLPDMVHIKLKVLLFNFYSKDLIVYFLEVAKLGTFNGLLMEIVIAKSTPANI